ncbi:thioredoxin-like protein [Euroglyphus maynei]|uniref:Thioredoxin-like protein n=1 Tax=Euroglyphus maynei TaxID=6958 RepID=A0A1Y3B930_EURMA|nr:thioredoxin-like protein [Euroglyphus maynei]
MKKQLKDAGDKLVVVDFYATWCGPCRLIAPVLEKMAEENKDKLVVLKVDVDENEELTNEYGITSMPTFVLIKNEQKVHSFSGASEQKLREAIQQYS